MNKLFYTKMLNVGHTDTLIIESYDQCRYQCFVVENGVERLLWDDDGRPLATFSLTEMRKKLFPLNPQNVFLRQRSAYDEMVGQPAKIDNTMMVPLALDSIVF